MAIPIHVPRVNNNDDTVSVVSIEVKEGDLVKRGQVVGAVETDKAVMDVEAESDGYVLRILRRSEDKASVGSVLMWLGANVNDMVPDSPPDLSSPVDVNGHRPPTAKARVMLKELGLEAAKIPAVGDRLTVADIESWLSQNRAAAHASAQPAHVEEADPQVHGKYEELSPEAHGMFVTVSWHRDHVAHGYMETEYDPKPWEDYAARYAQQHKLMLSPLTALMAYRLVELAKSTPHINASIVNGRRYQYGPINLGFTVQAGKTLYLIVVREAQDMDVSGFIEAMGQRQRNAMLHKLRASELTGATLSFSSMARWNVSRHVPILPPQTGLIVAHAAPRNTGRAVLGASYDHRLLTGHDVIQVLQALAQPPQ